MLNGDPEHKHYGLKTMPGVNYLQEVRHHLKSASGHHESDTDHHG
jgi:hypothetical protein